jgi:hypothetical protein
MGKASHLGSVVDVSFVDGGHMLAWAQALRKALRLLEQLLLGARAEVRAGLSDRKWRVLHGELPPRLRARAVAAHLTMQVTAVRSALKGVDLFELLLVGVFIEPARQAGEAERRRRAGGAP